MCQVRVHVVRLHCLTSWPSPNSVGHLYRPTIVVCGGLFPGVVMLFDAPYIELSIRSPLMYGLSQNCMNLPVSLPRGCWQSYLCNLSCHHSADVYQTQPTANLLAA